MNIKTLALATTIISASLIISGGYAISHRYDFYSVNLNGALLSVIRHDRWAGNICTLMDRASTGIPRCEEWHTWAGQLGPRGKLVCDGFPVETFQQPKVGKKLECHYE
jgi:hypothetical protein